MKHIFINSEEILTPDFFVMYYDSLGNKKQRIESVLNEHSLLNNPEAIKAELYKNNLIPELLQTIYKK